MHDQVTERWWGEGAEESLNDRNNNFVNWLFHSGYRVPASTLWRQTRLVSVSFSSSAFSLLIGLKLSSLTGEYIAENQGAGLQGSAEWVSMSLVTSADHCPWQCSAVTITIFNVVDHPTKEWMTFSPVCVSDWKHIITIITWWVLQINVIRTDSPPRRHCPEQTELSVIFLS